MMRSKSRSVLALGVATAMLSSTLGGLGTLPVQARPAHRSFIRRHPFLTAAGAALVYHHYHKKHKRQQMMRRR